MGRGAARACRNCLAATPCLDGFSRRFLRESTIFPVRAPNGGYRLAVADPSDTAAIRAAEIVFGEPVEVAVASFEDITTVLDQRIEADGAAAEEGARRSSQQSDDDIESLRDLASGAPVVRALNDLLERAVELRASDIHIEPFRTGLVVRMRVDGLLRAMPSPSGIPPQALDLARENSGRPQHRRAAPAAGRRGARARQPRRTRRPRRDHADAGGRERRHPSVAARPRPARNGQARPVRRATSGS